ncbi:MAG: hypothetical protein R3E50_11560 [Halioglobus sp.]
MKRLFPVLLALLLCGRVAASQGPLQKVGEARLNYLFWAVYDSRLYTRDGNYQDGQLPLRFEIQYLRDVDAADLLAHTREEWQRLGLSPGSERQWLQSLSRLWPDVRENDVLALEVDEAGRSAFLINGQPLGASKIPPLARTS